MTAMRKGKNGGSSLEEGDQSPKPKNAAGFRLVQRKFAQGAALPPPQPMAASPAPERRPEPPREEQRPVHQSSMSAMSLLDVIALHKVHPHPPPCEHQQPMVRLERLRREEMPGPSHATPGPLHATPGPSHATPGPSHASPGPSHATPGPSHATPGPSYATPGPTRAVPGPSYDTPRPSRAMPGPSRAMPGPSRAMPGSSRAMPGSSRAMPGPLRAMPGPSYATPGPSRALPGPSYATPGPSRAMPGPSYATPGPSRAMPRPSYATPGPSRAMPGSSYATPGPSRERRRSPTPPARQEPNRGVKKTTKFKRRMCLRPRPGMALNTEPQPSAPRAATIREVRVSTVSTMSSTTEDDLPLLYFRREPGAPDPDTTDTDSVVDFHFKRPDQPSNFRGRNNRPRRSREVTPMPWLLLQSTEPGPGQLRRSARRPCPRTFPAPAPRPVKRSDYARFDSTLTDDSSVDGDVPLVHFVEKLHPKCCSASVYKSVQNVVMATRAKSVFLRRRCRKCSRCAVIRKIIKLSVLVRQAFRKKRSSLIELNPNENRASQVLAQMRVTRPGQLTAWVFLDILPRPYSRGIKIEYKPAGDDKMDATVYVVERSTMLDTSDLSFMEQKNVVATLLEHMERQAQGQGVQGDPKVLVEPSQDAPVGHHDEEPRPSTSRASFNGWTEHPLEPIRGDPKVKVEPSQDAPVGHQDEEPQPSTSRASFNGWTEHPLELKRGDPKLRVEPSQDDPVGLQNEEPQPSTSRASFNGWTEHPLKQKWGEPKLRVEPSQDAPVGLQNEEPQPSTSRASFNGWTEHPLEPKRGDPKLRVEPSQDAPVGHQDEEPQPSTSRANFNERTEHSPGSKRKCFESDINQPSTSRGHVGMQRKPKRRRKDQKSEGNKQPRAKKSNANIRRPTGHNQVNIQTQTTDTEDDDMSETASTSERIAPKRIKVAPTFTPSPEEFLDPIAFFKSLEERAAPFGICKVVPPDTFKPPCKLLGNNRFSVVYQYISKLYNRWGPDSRELAAIKAYLWLQNFTIKRPPIMECSEINLPKLHHVVERYGGANKVVKYKRWGRVAEEMNLRQVRTSERRLDQVFIQYLLPYASLSLDERQKKISSVESGWTKKYQRIVKKAHRPFHKQERLLGEAASSEDESELPEVVVALREAEDCIVPGRAMNLTVFKKVAEALKDNHFDRKHAHSIEEIEQAYWHAVIHGDDHIVANAASIDTGDEGYGFPKFEAYGYGRHPYNLKMVAKHSDNVLRFLGDLLGANNPTLHLNMLFSTSCWHRDPHRLPWIEYLHKGEPKIWYGIPDGESENFRRAVQRLCPAFCQNKPIWLASDIAMIPPDTLVNHNVKLTRVVQNPGEYILVFPKAHSSSISTGFNVSESVYFATLDWLESAPTLFKGLRDSCEPSMFSLEQLLINGVSDENTPRHLLLPMCSVLSTLISDELENRRLLALKGLKIDKPLPPKRGPSRRGWNNAPECEFCRCTLFLSGVVGLTGKRGAFCTEHALKLLDCGKYRHIAVPELEFRSNYKNGDLEQIIRNTEARVLEGV